MHADPELLSLLALGEDVGSEQDRVHVQNCPECSGQVWELEHVVTLGRAVGADTTLAAPSPQVWDRIRDELGLGGAGEGSVPAEQPRRPVEAVAGTQRSLEGQTAHATLTPVAASWAAASGTAELAIDDQGRRILQVALTADLPSSGVRQAWLIHRDDPSVRQTLGILDGPHGLWTVDRSIDLQTFPILDISQQGAGETEHSGQTIVRGQLTLVS